MLFYSPGDPEGVGPEIVCSAIDASLPVPQVIFGDASWLRNRLESRGVLTFDFEETRAERPGIGLVDCATWPHERVFRATASSGSAQIAALRQAADAARKFRGALVTGPISKEAVALSGLTNFTGHTEYLAERCGRDADSVTMLFLGERLRVALVTTHASVCEAAHAISPARIERSLVHLREALQRLGIATPRIAVTGVNPHAGEAGLFGSEEARVITPTLSRLALPGVVGPIGAESAFRFAAEGSIDGVVAMLHDQATIASKLLDWGVAVNVTWGLDYVRTSVDHGVAYDAARHGTADNRGMRAAIQCATRLLGM